MRLQRPVYVRKPVASIALRVIARDLPEDAEVTVTDVQLQPGETPSGVTVNVREEGTLRGRTQYRNGVIHDDMEVVVLANMDRTTPTRTAVVNGRGNVQVGSYRFGEMNGSEEYADGYLHRASKGWGRPPLITARSDGYLRTKVEGGNNRAHLRMEWHDRETGEDDDE